MYNIIPLIIILACLVIIIMIVSKKFSILANIDIENIPQEKEAKIKEQIISNRLKRNVIKWSSKLIVVTKFLGSKISAFSKWAYKKLHDIRDDYKSERKIRSKGSVDIAKEMHEQIEELIKEEQYEMAEKKLIELIGLNSKDLLAFEKLANLYFEEKNYGDAKQTYEHLLKLTEDIEEYSNEAEIYFNLSLISKSTEDYPEALENIKKALKIHPNNPRFLDTMLEISIINKDKIAAMDAYKSLEKANPENQKLKEFKKQIKEL